MTTPTNQSLFTKMDCFRLYVEDLEAGLKYYRDGLGLKLIWRTDTAIGLGMDNDVTEIVINNERQGQEVDLKVDSVYEAVKTIVQAGGRVIVEPFDIRIGKCAVVEDPWKNQYVILDSSKGTFVTDGDGNVIGS
ncbi:VOC family protein [Fusibacter sp. JL216-2]|uniref:VOC family protein n=1 Tax=Fusibacter sp. JL216-2 TaxID=3071453 RepID=UPI003D338416